MKGIAWVVALIFMIPSYGISLVIAFFITSVLNEQEKIKREQQKIFLKLSIVNSYKEFRSGQGLSETQISKDEIFERVCKLAFIIKEHLKRNYIAVTDHKIINKLAIKITSYSEDHLPEDFSVLLNESLIVAVNFGLANSLELRYVKSQSEINYEKANLENHQSFLNEFQEFLEREDPSFKEFIQESNSSK